MVDRGRIKSGEGTLIGNAGEYYVVAELLKRGVNAALAARNAPDFDILATRAGRTVRIRVKTKSEQYAEYQWNIKPDGTIFRHLGKDDDFAVLVNLTRETADLEFFVVPTQLIDLWLRETFQNWVTTPGPRKPQRDPTNKKRHLNSKVYADRLRPFRNAWGGLWESVVALPTRSEFRGRPRTGWLTRSAVVDRMLAAGKSTVPEIVASVMADSGLKVPKSDANKVRKLVATRVTMAKKAGGIYSRNTDTKVVWVVFRGDKGRA